MVYHILVASYTNDVVTLAFDEAKGTLDVKSSLTVGHHPSWITSHPDHPSLVWTGLEQSEGKLLALRYDTEGKLELVSETDSAGKDPCTLLALKDELLVGNYSSGNIGSVSLTSSAYFTKSPASVQFHGTGPNTDRQEASHPHQVIFHEANQELLVPDLGADVVRRLKKSPSGEWKPAGHVGFELGGGPRHVAFYGGDLFTALELSNKVVRHRFPALPAKPTFVKSAPSLSNPRPTPGEELVAEILIPAPNSTFSTPYLYLSNRNDPSPEGDVLSIFSIEAPESLDLIAEVRSGLKHLRGMVFFGPDDKYLVAGGARGGGVKVFERFNGGLEFKVVAANPGVEAPTGFLVL